GGTTASKRAAYAHIVFNTLGVALLILIFKPYVSFVHYMVFDVLGWADVPANTLNQAGDAPQIAQYIAMSHSMFNILNTIIWLPFLGILAKIVIVLVPDKEEEVKTELKFIDPEFLSIPSLALEKARIEILSLGEEVSTMLQTAYDVLAQKRNIKESVKRVLVLEEHIDNIQKEITVYLVKLSSKDLNREQSKENQSMIRAVDELESIGDYCERIVTISKRISYDDITFSEDATIELNKIMSKVIKFYDLSNTGYLKKDRSFLPEANIKKQNIREFAEFVRKKNMERLNTGSCNSIAGLLYINMISEFEHITSHIINLAEAYVGEK
ncbi:MAG: Na/Pi cotransporter family protein, partial [Deltaproteobacteria bacterium]|nr:Na/Pi cotransporter family protein [Deltaproteobacteria bacterium]